VSHGYDPAATAPRFREEFDWTGTLDPTPALCIPECLRLLGALLPGGWAALMARNRALALAARELLGERLGVAAPAPASMIATLATVPLPTPAAGAPAAGLDGPGIMNWLRQRAVESFVAPAPGDGRLLVRVSAQVYNDLGQFGRLADLLAAALGRG
jgi:isopenicillin-N epimerase